MTNPVRHRPLAHNPETIKARRLELGMYQAELAAKAGTSQSVISQLEAGSKTVGPKKARELADALGCTVAELSLPYTPTSSSGHSSAATRHAVSK